MLVILMGVSGSGKTTVGRLLAERLGWAFLEADEFHPESNRKKLAEGTPLTDEDRWPWLDSLNEGLRQAVRQSGSVVLACSALKDSYRDRLDEGLRDIRWVHLAGDPELLAQRLKDRKGHFSSAKILRSQFETLEQAEEAIEVSVEGTPAQVVELAARALGLATVDPAATDRLIVRNVLTESETLARSGEHFEDLLHGHGFRLERIVSHGQSSPEKGWYDQDHPEWVVLLTGRAKLELDGNPNPYDLSPGDAWLIPAHRRHRVAWTDPDHPSVWLAIHLTRTR